MNRYEKEEISMLPAKYRPLGAWSYFGYVILFSIPIVAIIFSFIDSNINRRSFARSYVCAWIIAIVIVGITLAIVIGTVGLDALMNAMRPQ